MFHNYLTITIRNLSKQRLYAAINIGGLALGLSCFIIIFLYVQLEFSYNQFYPHADRIYRVYQKQTGNVYLGSDYFGVTPAGLAPIMREQLPEVAEASCMQESSGLFKFEDRSVWERGLSADDHFFRVFKISLISGNPETALLDSKSVVLTRSMATRIFGEKDPIGQTIFYQDGREFHVTGIVEDAPVKSSIKYSFIVSLLSDKGYQKEISRAGWNNNSYFTFFVLKDNANASDVEKSFSALITKYHLPEDYANYPFSDQYFVTALTDLYFQTNINFDIGIKGNATTVYLFGVVAVVVLLLACVNYMNLAVARSIKRSREVGLRKVVGARRWQLIRQFLGESLLIAFLSLVVAVGLTYLVLPYFGKVMERPVAVDFPANPLLLPGLLLLVLVVGLLSGSYPAFIMSSLKPADVLSANGSVRISGISLQRALIIIQFVASITLAIGSLIIYRQLRFIQRRELGYDKSDVVTMRLRDPSLTAKFPNLAHAWSLNPDILGSTLSTSLPTNVTSSTMVSKKMEDKEKRDLAIYNWEVGHDFTSVFGIKLASGRTFSSAMKTDATSSCIINETAAKAFGWSAEGSIGKQINYGKDGGLTVIGVVKDFHMHSMHLAIQPLMIRLNEEYASYFSVRIKPGKSPQTLAYIAAEIKKNSDYPFEYQFLDEVFTNLYASEMKLAEIFIFFTGVSILIATLGLFGLAAFLAGQRTREIGIRKVLGASVTSIVFLLSGDFLKQVIAAFALAAPLSWYISNHWLQDFAYRVKMEWWIFVLTGTLIFLIANLSILYQSLMASRANPVDSLRRD